MSEEIAIRVEHVSKDFVLPHEKVNSVKSLFTNAAKRRGKQGKETQHALKNISFEVKKGEFLGIVGRNGSGKSTLLKILASIYQPTSGKTYTQGKLVPFIELGVGFNPELTGRENVYLNGAMLGFSRKEIDVMYDSIVSFAELERFMDQKLKNYSSGMQVRLAFSMAVRAEADILLIDEVLAVGDADFQRKCYDYFKKLKKYKKTVVFVSHDMSAIREFCVSAILIEDNKLRLSGSPTDISREYSQLFMDNQDDGEKDISKRWGNGDVKITDVSAKLSGEEVLVKVKARAYKQVDKVVYGFHVVAQDGSEITAMNNQMIQAPSVEGLKPGQEVDFEWRMLNVFNDGKYSITLTLIDDSATTLDWLTEAASLTIKRLERSTTAILPPVSVSYKVKEGQKDEHE